MSDLQHLQRQYPASITAEDAIPSAALRALDYLCRYFDVSVEGADNIPDNGVMLVGNHSHFGIDSLGFFPAIYEETGRIPRGMALRSLFNVPIVRDVLHELGAVSGNRDTCRDLLECGEMVVSYPGGSKDSIKGRGDQYELEWGRRQGFSDVAVRAGVPIVPFAAIGPDEVFPVLTNRGVLFAPWLGDWSYKVPVVLPVPRRVPFTFHVGEPIEPPDIPGGADSVDLHRIARDHATRVRHSLQSLIDEGLARREERDGDSSGVGLLDTVRALLG